MMHHNNKFGNKMFGGLEDIIWTNIDILILYFDLDPECRHSQDTLAYDDVSSDQIRLPRNQQFGKDRRKGHTMIIWALAVDLKDSPHFFSSAWHSGSWCCITIPNLVTKCSVTQMTLPRQTFIDILNLHCDLDLKHSNPIFPQDTPAKDAVPSLVANWPAV